ncbi:MAG TPA: RNA methyltransferase [Puia sp.]|nr:RNA methyltransferase [Puia sp.]
MLVKSQAKYIQSLSQKKFRDEQNAFVAEGPKIINELLGAANVELLHLYGLKTWLDMHADLIKSVDENKITEVRESELERISFLQTPNQALAVFKKPFFGKPSFEGKVTVLLDGIQDPGNLGTIVRTADWFGVENVICSKESADVFNPKTVQSTMGSISRIQVNYQDLKIFLDAYPRIPLYAASVTGGNLFEIDRIYECFILVGNESKGISKELLDRSSHQISIPGKGGAESLNVAVAAGIILAWVNKS